jgi:hypothetical protein
MSTKPKLISLSDLAIHPRLEPIFAAISTDRDVLFPPPLMVHAASAALKTQVFSIVSDGKANLLTGPILGCLPIFSGQARVSTLICRRDLTSDPSVIVERAWHEIVLLMAFWPSQGRAESQARDKIGAMPDDIRQQTLGLRGRSIAELALVLNTSRHRLMGPKGPAPSAPSPGLGFSIDDLKRATRDER